MRYETPFEKSHPISSGLNPLNILHHLLEMMALRKEEIGGVIVCNAILGIVWQGIALSVI